MKYRQEIKCYDDLLYAYSKANKKIVKNTSKEMKQARDGGIMVLTHLFNSYKDEKKLKSVASTEPTQKEDFNFFSKPLLSFGIQENSKNQPKNYFKSVKRSVKTAKELLKQQFQDALKIESDDLEGLKDLKSEGYEDDEQLLTVSFGQQLKLKGMEQIIKESGRKLYRSPHKIKTQIEENLSEYEMSNYSSNESSNNGDYEENYRFEEELSPLFPGLGEKSKTFTENTTQLFPKFPPASQNGHGKSKCLVFKSLMTDILKSPKKNPPNKKKRLYIGKKKVPRWAADKSSLRLGEVNEGKDLFGECKVEHLDTNLIFKVFEKQIIERTSSAKWSPYMFQI